MASASEPRNPLYFLLLVAGVVFAVTALAYAILPVLQQKALDAGEIPAPSPFLDALKAYGWVWLLVEVAVVAVLSIASMAWDRLLTLQKERAEATIPPAKKEEKPS
jgi:amino acid transporter